ncbi:MAG TPA: hypothetical protein VN226_02575 [Anaerolineales bacterium]|nr:hypothetical protein [Anaerolineales bacterium]
MNTTGRTRAEVELRAASSLKSNFVDRLPTDCEVEILENTNRTFKVKPTAIKSGVSGYLPSIAVIQKPESIELFPKIQDPKSNRKFNTVPESLKLSEFLEWANNKKSVLPWLSAHDRASINPTKIEEIIQQIISNTLGKKAEWGDWIQAIKANERFGEATMKEWIVMLAGGREMFSIRDHIVYTYPDRADEHQGWILSGQIARWNGVIKKGKKNGELRNFCEVDFYRINKEMHGFIREELLEDYVYPDPNTDVEIDSNREHVFDLKARRIRLPEDDEIIEAKNKGYTASQYIDVFKATQKHLIHFSLCGEICVAMITNNDIIPLLKNWLDSGFWRAPAILKDPHEGTSVADLQSILEIYDLNGEVYSSIPTSAAKIKAKLDEGKIAIVGAGINSAGVVLPKGRIRHWVVLTDIIPSGNNGWVRVYNPFHNQEEVYRYDDFIASSGVGAGLWIQM